MGDGDLDRNVWANGNNDDANAASEDSKVSLLTPFQMGPFKLQHRVVMAPLTRARCIGGIPGDHVSLYYAQRATPSGLLISEGTGVSEDSRGFPNMPGIWTREQVEAWTKVVKGVHDKGAVFFCQIFHAGRYSHTSFHNGAAPVSSTSHSIKTGQLAVATGDSFADFSTPRALATQELADYVNHVRTAARNAISAGCDGVEVQGAHGMLIDEFLKSSVNDRRITAKALCRTDLDFWRKWLLQSRTKSGQIEWACGSPHLLTTLQTQWSPTLVLSLCMLPVC